MLRISTYVVVALLIVLLAGSRAHGGMMCGSDVGAGPRQNAPLPMYQGPPGNIAVEAPLLNIVEPRNFETLPLVSWKLESTMLAVEQGVPTSELVSIDTWNLDMSSRAITSFLVAGPILGIDSLQWRTVALAGDIRGSDSASILGSTGLAMTNIPLAASIGNDCEFMSPSLEVSAGSVEASSLSPSFPLLFEPPDHATITNTPASMPFNKDGLPGLPERRLPQEAIRNPTGSETLTRTLRSTFNSERLRIWERATLESLASTNRAD